MYPVPGFLFADQETRIHFPHSFEIMDQKRKKQFESSVIPNLLYTCRPRDGVIASGYGKCEVFCT